ncbi:two pore potassium channel protein sup-9-like [Brevipalpus obovatus]|uniref:two pore potassium channel protein sup-9-like n=1 Tax=Brevipalpus obovatus TaxID=246614 RepID=UPI003D9DEC93
MKRQNRRTIALIVCTSLYLLLGATFFDVFESEHEVDQRRALESIESMLKRKYNMSEQDFKIMTTVVIKSVPHKAGVQWKFAGAFYFATTVLTTIGYGHSTPATVGGKAFCMFYALGGIPLGLVVFQCIGERLNTFVAYSLKCCKKCFRMKKHEVSETHLVMFVLFLSILVMTTGAAVFSEWERWSYFDAFYYCFITLTTIGFGDYVALQKESALQSEPEYVVFSLLFILFGLSVVSGGINLLVLRLLTVNTEDERRDEAEAALTAATAVHLEGDVITANGSIISGHGPEMITPDSDDIQSVCSCTCYSKPSKYRQKNSWKKSLKRSLRGGREDDLDDINGDYGRRKDRRHKGTTRFLPLTMFRSISGSTDLPDPESIVGGDGKFHTLITVSDLDFEAFENARKRVSI